MPNCLCAYHLGLDLVLDARPAVEVLSTLPGAARHPLMFHCAQQLHSYVRRYHPQPVAFVLSARADVRGEEGERWWWPATGFTLDHAQAEFETKKGAAI